MMIEKNTTELHFAPLEGISWYVYRNMQAKHFAKADLYIAPFIAPNQKREIRENDKRDVLPENNKNMPLIPQLIGNRPDEFLDTARQLKELGYEEVNFNLGCPSNTVVAKKKGSGFLTHLYDLQQFLDTVYTGMDALSMKMSIKTRIGRYEPSEFEEILELYNQYDMPMLTIHPRIQKEFYRGQVHMDVFDYAYTHSKNPVCYNGDIETVSDYVRLKTQYPDLKAVMLGRGMIANPALMEMIRQYESGELTLVNGEVHLSEEQRSVLTKRLKAFHDELLKEYETILSGDVTVLHKMKEQWNYMITAFELKEDYGKRIRKAGTLMEYKGISNAVFATSKVKKIW